MEAGNPGAVGWAGNVLDIARGMNGKRQIEGHYIEAREDFILELDSRLAPEPTWRAIHVSAPGEPDAQQRD